LDETTTDSHSRIGFLVQLLGHNEWALRFAPRRIENAIGVLVKYPRQGGNCPLWPEKGYKSKAHLQD
jgi:hypothetical protein